MSASLYQHLHLAGRKGILNFFQFFPNTFWIFDKFSRAGIKLFAKFSGLYRRVEIAYSIPHVDYNPGTFDNDLAVVALTEKIDLTAEKACLICIGQRDVVESRNVSCEISSRLTGEDFMKCAYWSFQDSHISPDLVLNLLLL
jgi:hypothetical protein